MKSEIILTAKNFSVQYAGTTKPVFSDLSFTLHRGDFVLLSGISGAGKSTLLKLINGLLPTSTSENTQHRITGHLYVHGDKKNIDITGEPAHKRAYHIGSVLQNADEQIIFQTVQDEIVFPLENLCRSKETMEGYVDTVSKTFSPSITSETECLSGGEKQQLITASTLGMNQRILIFDEPLANLDSQSTTALLTKLKQLCEKGYAVIFIEHRIDRVLPYCNICWWLTEGMLKEFKHKSEFEMYFKNQIQLSFHNERLVSAHSEKKAPAVVIEHADVCIKKKKILTDISLTIHEGEKWVIVGQNGAGKTTLLHLIAGVLKPSAGSVFCKAKKKQQFKKIGLVMQNPQYQLFMPTVQDELAFQAKQKQTERRLIELFDFTPLLNSHPQSLSEGQKRRLGVAAILSMNPEIVLFDEPTVGQDYENMYRIIHAVRDADKETPLTTITITHDARCANFFGDHIIVLKHGSISRSGLLEQSMNICDYI